MKQRENTDALWDAKSHSSLYTAHATGCFGEKNGWYKDLKGLYFGQMSLKTLLKMSGGMQFRLSRNTFEFVLQPVELNLIRKNTNWRKPLEPLEIGYCSVVVCYPWRVPYNCLFGVGLPTLCTLVHKVTATSKRHSHHPN